jgi:hypothetical protein
MEKIKIQLNVFLSCHLPNNVEMYCRVGQATNDNTVNAFACWITKATNIHSEYIIRIVFPLQQ